MWWLSCLLGEIWWQLGIRRFILYRNVTTAFPSLPRRERKALVRLSLSHLAYSFFEVLKIPAIDENWIRKHVTIDGVEHLDEARARGRGVLLLSLHLANGDLGVTALSLCGFKVHLISKRFHIRWMNDLWWSIRGSKGTRLIDAHHPDNSFRILKALKSKDAVIFVLDQFMGKPFGLPTTFFGRKTATAYGLALFAMKTQAPVLLVHCYRTPEFHTHVVFGPEIPLIAEVGTQEERLMRQTQAFNTAIENAIKSRPEQWMWVHRRWKTYQ